MLRLVIWDACVTDMRTASREWEWGQGGCWETERRWRRDLGWRQGSGEGVLSWREQRQVRLGRTCARSLTSGSAVPRCCHLPASGSSDLSFPPCCRQGTELTRIMCKEGTAASEGLTGGILWNQFTWCVFWLLDPKPQTHPHPQLRLCAKRWWLLSS